VLGALRDWLRVVWACAAKDLRSALTERSTMLQSVSLPINYLIMMSLFALSGSAAPTAVIMLDHGRYAQQFLASMEHSDSFRLRVESAGQARAQLHQGTLVAAVTIPANFDRAVAANQPVQVPMQVNNLDEDLTDDVHRAIRLSVTTFYARTDPKLVSIITNEQDAYRSDTGYIPFLAISITVIALMVSGLLQAGNAAAREFEKGTIKELLLAPARPWTILIGRMLGAFLISLPAGVIVVTVVIIVVGGHPADILLVTGVCLLTLAVFVAAGTAFGLIIRDRSAFTILTRAIPVPLFFLSGVFSPLTFQTRAVYDAGVGLPVHYAVVLEQLAFKGFRTGTLSPAVDALVLAGYFAAFAGLAVLALRFTSMNAGARRWMPRLPRLPRARRGTA
jgi:ABC-2 type transport system permease protein